MKKMWLMLGLLVTVALVIAGCGTGQAVNVGGKTVKLECRQFLNFDELAHPNQFCIKQKYDACVHGEMIARIPNGDLKTLYTMPLACEGYDFLSTQIDINDPDAVTKFFVKENTGYDGNLGDSDSVVTCCRVR